MSIPVSTAPQVKAYLVTQITNAVTPDADSRLRVFYGPPATDLPNDVIVVGDVTARTTQHHAFVGGGGALARNETYTVAVEVDAFRGGDNAQLVEERAWTLAGVVETVVRTDPSLGGLVVEAWPAAQGVTETWDETHLGRHARITVAVTVLAVL